MPRMAFMGVRISWLTLARNSSLARLAASAASFACRNSSSGPLAIGDVAVLPMIGSACLEHPAGPGTVEQRYDPSPGGS